MNNLANRHSAPFIKSAAGMVWKNQTKRGKRCVRDRARQGFDIRNHSWLYNECSSPKFTTLCIIHLARSTPVRQRNSSGRRSVSTWWYLVKVATTSASDRGYLQRSCHCSDSRMCVTTVYNGNAQLSDNAMLHGMVSCFQIRSSSPQSRSTKGLRT